MMASADEDLALDELYHCNSKHSPARLEHMAGREMRRRERAIHGLYERSEGKCKTYPSAPRLALPSERAPLGMSLDAAIVGRRSCRRFAPGALSIAEIGTLLAHGYGACGRRGRVIARAVPSGGGLYPLDVYVLQCAGGAIDEGVYHYHAGDHALQRIRARCERSALERASLYPDIVGGAALLLAVVADMPRTRAKYGERAYRLALLEAGHVSENLYLVAHALGLGIVALDGFYDDRVHGLLDVDGVAEIAVVLFALGRVDE